MELLFPIFLEDEAEYDQVVNFWKEVFASMLTGTTLEYKPYLNATTVDGISLRDGNPIFDAFFPRLNKAVRIIQEEPDTDSDLQIGVWLDETEIKNPSEPVQELVISLVLTDTSLLLAKQLIGKYILEDSDRQSMKVLIDEIV